jgi:hypothetical protein
MLNDISMNSIDAYLNFAFSFFKASQQIRICEMIMTTMNSRHERSIFSVCVCVIVERNKRIGH